MADGGAGSLWACWGALCKSPNSPKVDPKKTVNFDDDVGNLELDHTMTRMDGDGGATEKVVRPYSAWGKFFGMKFKDRVTTKGSLTRSPALATVGDRCKMVNNMDEMASSSAQRSSLPLPLLS